MDKPHWFSPNQLAAMREPNWSDLLPEIVESIADLLIADDLTDFISFRAVCQPWRSSTKEMKRNAACLHPHNWIMLSNPKLTPSEPVQFYNTFTHKSFWFDLKVYLDQYSLFRTFACLMILQNKSTQEFALLNPFMGSITKLPSKIESDCPKAPAKLEDIIHATDMEKRLSDVYITSSSTIVLKFSTLDYLIWTKPGDRNWVYAEFKVLCITNTVFFDNRILFIDPEWGVVQINFANEMSSQPCVEVVITDPDVAFVEAKHLVICNDTIFMVTYPLDIGDDYSFELYKLDFKNEKCARSTNLGDCSLFLGLRTFSVASKNHLIPANCIYFCNLYFDQKALYNLSTKHLKFSDKKPFINPNPLIRKLINFSLRPEQIFLWHGVDSITYHYED